MTIRVGIIGLEPDRSWGAKAHIPALRSLPDYNITAVSTTRQKSADAAAARYDIPNAFANHQALVSSPEVDLVAVTVKVPYHRELVSAGIAAGKHTFCEWPLGNGLEEAEQMAALARTRGVHSAVGLQARSSPVLMYVRDLVARGYVGDVLSTSLIGTGMNWGEYVDASNAHTADRANGATLFTIPFAHTVDAVCHVLGDVKELSALTGNRRQSTTLVETGESLKLTAEDQIAMIGTLAGGAVICAHYRGGLSHGTGLLWEINGTAGDIRVTGIGGHAQLLELSLSGATLGERAMSPLSIPDSYYLTPLREGVALNVAQGYALLASDPRHGTHLCPNFGDAVVTHRMVSAIERSQATGTRQAP